VRRASLDGSDLTSTGNQSRSDSLQAKKLRSLRQDADLLHMAVNEGNEANAAMARKMQETRKEKVQRACCCCFWILPLLMFLT